MGRTEIIERLAKKIYGNPSIKELQQCSQFCDTLVDIITESLINGKRVLWKGFISAEVTDTPPTKRRNPKTGEVELYNPSVKISCKLSKAIKDKIKENRK